MEKYAAQNQNFKIQVLNLWVNWENLSHNLRFTVENKVENSDKKGWSHFKLNINDCGIPSSKILRTGKNIFHWRKWNETTGNPPITQNV